MNVETGEIKKMQKLSKEEFDEIIQHPDRWAMLWKLPKKSCGHCYGRGYTGRDMRTGHFVPCRCTGYHPE